MSTSRDDDDIPATKKQPKKLSYIKFFKPINDVARQNNILTNELLQLGANGQLKIWLNIKLSDKQCIREAAFVAKENGKKISYPFTLHIPEKEELDNLKEATRGKNPTYEFNIVNSSGYELLPKEIIKQLITQAHVETSFFEIEGRTVPERMYVQRYLGHKDELLNTSPIKQQVDIGNLYVRDDEVEKKLTNLTKETSQKKKKRNSKSEKPKIF